MIVGVFSLRDAKLSGFSRPFFAQTEAQAVRMVQDLVNSGQQDDVCKHPDDFELWCLGSFDDEFGELVSDVKAVILCSSLVVAKP